MNEGKMVKIVTLRFIIGILITLCIKKTSLINCNSCWFSLYPHEATDVKEYFIMSSIWDYKQEHGRMLRPKHDLRMLLILAGDIELCPGPAMKCGSCLKTIRKSQMQSKCDTCKTTYHSKCIIDRLNDTTESYICNWCDIESTPDFSNGISNDNDHDSLTYSGLKQDLKTRGPHQNVNGIFFLN